MKKLELSEIRVFNAAVEIAKTMMQKINEPTDGDLNEVSEISVKLALKINEEVCGK